MDCDRTALLRGEFPLNWAKIRLHCCIGLPEMQGRILATVSSSAPSVLLPGSPFFVCCHLPPGSFDCQWQLLEFVRGEPGEPFRAALRRAQGERWKRLYQNNRNTLHLALVRQGEGRVWFLGLVSVRSGFFVARVKGEFETRPYVKRVNFVFSSHFLLFPVV